MYYKIDECFWYYLVYCGGEFWYWFCSVGRIWMMEYYKILFGLIFGDMFNVGCGNIKDY